MSNKIEAIIEGQPFAQKRHRTSGNGHRYDPSAKDKKKIQRALIDVKPSKPLQGVFRLTITAFFQTPKSWPNKKQQEVEGTFRPKYPDTDNIAKIIMDAMNDYIIEDDRYIVSTQVEKYYSMNPCTVINLEQIVSAN